MFSRVVLPPGAPEELADRQILWNAVERKNVHPRAVVAREIRLALPAELSEAERLQLVLRFAIEISEEYEIAVDVAVHAPSRGGDADARNFHAHLLCTTDRITYNGLENKVRVLDAVARDRDPQARGLKNPVERMRERWAALTNEYLARAGVASRIDHRSYARIAAANGTQAKLPTYHLGPTMTALERRGTATAVGDYNRLVLLLRETQVQRDETDREVAEAEKHLEGLKQGMHQISVDDLPPASNRPQPYAIGFTIDDAGAEEGDDFRPG